MLIIVLAIAIPVAIAGAIWAWCMCRVAARPTPRLSDRYREHEGNDMWPTDWVTQRDVKIACTYDRWIACGAPGYMTEDRCAKCPSLKARRKLHAAGWIECDDKWQRADDLPLGLDDPD